MIASERSKTQVLVEPQVREKLRLLPEMVHALLSGHLFPVPDTPGRDVQILPIRALPPKPGLSKAEGQARLLHDLASIELQAMELALRTLCEYPEAPHEFRERLAQITLEEGQHLALCLDAMDSLGRPWGSFPTHLGLWQAVDPGDSLLDRVLIVHRYLEGSGLDASDTILRRLSGVNAKAALKAVQVIRRDELDHVRFGSEWYARLAKSEGLDPDHEFGRRLDQLFHRIPRRLEPINEATRLAAGFSVSEIQQLERLRQRWMNPEAQIHPEG